MRTKSILLASIALLMSASTFCVTAQEVVSIKIFKTTSMRVEPSNNHSSESTNLDAGENIIGLLGKDLPYSLEKAEQEIARRMETGEGRELVKKIGTSYDGVVEAWSLGIEKLPAILINKQYVVYGVYSVDKAIQIYRDKLK